VTTPEYRARHLWIINSQWETNKQIPTVGSLKELLDTIPTGVLGGEGQALANILLGIAAMHRPLPRFDEAFMHFSGQAELQTSSAYRAWFSKDFTHSPQGKRLRARLAYNYALTLWLSQDWSIYNLEDYMLTASQRIEPLGDDSWYAQAQLLTALALVVQRRPEAAQATAIQLNELMLPDHLRNIPGRIINNQLSFENIYFSIQDLV
jgi:hypothetical protein